MNDKKSNKIIKAVKGTGIAIKVVLVLGGIAMAAYFAWLGYKFYLLLGV